MKFTRVTPVLDCWRELYPTITTLPVLHQSVEMSGGTFQILQQHPRNLLSPFQLPLYRRSNRPKSTSYFTAKPSLRSFQPQTLSLVPVIRSRRRRGSFPDHHQPSSPLIRPSGAKTRSSRKSSENFTFSPLFTWFPKHFFSFLLGL